MIVSPRLGARLALVLALVADLFTFGVTPLGRGPSVASIQAALAAQAQVTNEWLALDGVVGTAVGMNGPGNAVLTVYVTTLGLASLPQSVAGVPIRIEAIGRIKSLSDPPSDSRAGQSLDPGEMAHLGADSEGTATDVNRKASFPRPVPIGVSIGHPDVTAGTIGARVTDGSRVFVLSNNHVLAANNLARQGDNLLQPGVFDGGRDPEDALATLHDFEPIQFCGGIVCPFNQMDAAVALATTDDLGTGTPDDGYGTPRSGTIGAVLGMRVQKYGRTTGHTIGRVTGINATLDVDYRGGRARFKGQIVITSDGEFSTGGDSGSLIVTKGLLMGDRRPVGLLFAGSPTNTVANPIDLVLDRFGVSIDGG